MKKLKKIIALSLLPLLLGSCKPKNPSATTGEEDTTPSITINSNWKTKQNKTNIEVNENNKWKYTTFYQLLVYSFADGNGDGIGDFKGIEDHLDYLKDLGVGAIWLSPICQSDSYHSYDVTDYYKIKQDYEVSVGGVKYDFKHLVNACHEKGIKVILDMVFNHTSSNHVWFKEHRDWYSNVDAFGGNMKDLNYDNKEVREAIKDVGKFWLKQGADGFRLDAAVWIYNNGDTSGTADIEKDNAWWTEFGEAMREVKPDCYLVGEVLTGKHPTTSLLNSGLDSTFNLKESYRIAIKNDAAGYSCAWASNGQSFQKESRNEKETTIESNVISNHDIGRFNQNYSLTKKKAIEYGNALNLLSPGDPYIYFGDELGMEGKTESGALDSNYRTEMPFSTGRTNSQIYMGVKSTSTTFSGKHADEDAKDPDSIYSFFKKVISFKNAHPALYYGTATAIGQSYQDNIEALRFEAGDKDIVIVGNTSEDIRSLTFDKAKVEVPKLLETFDTGKSESTMKDNIFTLAPRSIAAFEISTDFTYTTEKGKREQNTNEESKAVDPDAKKKEDNPTPKPTPTVTKYEDKYAKEDAATYDLPAVKEGKIRVHFKNTEDWTAVDCYAWTDSDVKHMDWPGEEMTKEGDSHWYYFDVPSNLEKVIFNSGSNANQTVNIDMKNAETFYKLYDDSGTNDQAGTKLGTVQWASTRNGTYKKA